MRQKLNNKLIKVLIFILVLTVLIFGQNNNIYSVNKNITGNAEKFGEKNIIEFTVLENELELYRVNVNLEYDIAVPDLKVFEDGRSVLINSFEASLTIYDNEGSEYLKTKMIKDLAVEYERSVYSSISGEHVAVSLSQPDRDYSTIQIYNSLGQLIENWQLPEKFINGLSYSNNNDLLSISVYDWHKGSLEKSTLFLQSDGKNISKVPHNFTNGKYVEKENIFIGYTNEICFIYDIKENKILHTRQSLNNKMILLADYIDNLLIIIDVDQPYLENGKWFYRDPDSRGFEIRGDYIFIRDNKISNPFSEYELVKSKSGIYLKTEIDKFRVK